MRFPSPLIVILLCGVSLTACASSGNLSEPHAAKNKAGDASDPASLAANQAPAMDLEAGVRQAQTQRLAGQYDDAIRTLSQLMLVASDDPRVIGEYGKTLAEKGRAQDAVQFLTRATDLQQGDWSLYSALGVAYDQVGNQASAQLAYERALKLKPEDPSVLNNYALSRMLANDPDGARKLIDRAQAAGGASDSKIARNIDMMNKLAANAPQQPKPAAAEPAPVAVPVAVSSNALAPAAPAQQAAPATRAKVVMQAIPADPLAEPAKAATHEPTPLHKPADALAKSEIKPTSETVATAKDVKPAPIKAAAVQPSAPNAKTEATVDLRPASVKSVADAKPGANVPAKPASKNGIPALRQTASAY
ncbi:MAG TPA: tetratricopeptide repeat protein [Rhizomicrobium sp.]|jgi:Flp pilus assembly protein TadD